MLLPCQSTYSVLPAACNPQYDLVLITTRHGCHPHSTLHGKTLEDINRSVETLHKLLSEGHDIYGELANRVRTR
jgi:hypothetical protein